jgi:hypothetical protein
MSAGATVICRRITCKADWGAYMPPVGSVPLVLCLKTPKDGLAAGGVDGNLGSQSLQPALGDLFDSCLSLCLEVVD